MKKVKVMTVFGTRPEAIKMAPVILELKKRSRQFDEVTVVTGQHREMLDQVLSVFHIEPKYNLNVMESKQTLSSLTSKVLLRLGKIIEKEKPYIVLVHGDTTTTFAAGVAAFYQQTRVGHVEAGLRTWNKYSPYPEEMNRQLTDVLSDLYFAPTEQSRTNLLHENHPKEQIFVTGNTAIDALNQTVRQDYQHPVLNLIDTGKKMILVTMHRRENQGAPMRRVFKVMREIVETHPDIEIVFPVHLNPNVQEAANSILGSHERIHLIAPLDVVDFHNLAAHSYFIMTDSGGVQEEAPSLGKPVLVLRDTTERPEGVRAGTLKLVGTDPNTVKTAMLQLMDDNVEYQRMAMAENPYGDGHASQRIADIILNDFIKG